MTPQRRARRPVLPPPVIALAIGIAMWGLSVGTDAFRFEFPGRGAIALAVAGAGLLIDLVSVVAFIRARTTVNPLAPDKANALVVSGLYRFSRNPMYLGMLLILLGWALWLGQSLALPLLAAFVIAIEALQIRPEEAALEQKFGDEYRAYKKRVRRWI